MLGQLAHQRRFASTRRAFDEKDATAYTALIVIKCTQEGVNDFVPSMKVVCGPSELGEFVHYCKVRLIVQLPFTVDVQVGEE
ncbi:MAG: hypothetical protein OXE59_10255 [Bacteroidetes bacterium]|nr:hypothetical protein [Bacteroidota bacterium]